MTVTEMHYARIYPKASSVVAPRIQLISLRIKQTSQVTIGFFKFWIAFILRSNLQAHDQ